MRGVRRRPAQTMRAKVYKPFQAEACCHNIRAVSFPTRGVLNRG